MNMQPTSVLARAPRRPSLASALRVARPYIATLGAPVFLSAVVLILYLPSLGYGLHWDDPLWYAQGQNKSFYELLRALPTYQYYRPLAVYVNRLLCTPYGTVRAQAAHAIQVAAHLGAILLLVPVLRGLGIGRLHANLAALLFAVHPFCHQAVAWQAPQQPVATMWVLLSVLVAQRYVAYRRASLLGLSTLAYAAGLLYQESAVPALWLFAYVAWQDARERGLTWRRGLTKHAWLMAHATLAAAYLAMWLTAPRSEGITGWAFEGDVLAYLLQGTVYPLAWALARAPMEWPPLAVLFLCTAALGALIAVLGRRDARRAATLGAAWIVTGILSTWAGLRWEYVEVGPRLLYPAIPGVAILWAGAVHRAWDHKPLARWGGIGLLALLLIIALGQDVAFSRLMRIGTDHLANAVEAMTRHPGSTQLYVNFPDRLELRNRPYPLGFWGLTLAPIVQDLADYAAVTTGVRVRTLSLAAPELGWADREASPYRADLRGVQAGYEALADAAVLSDAVYITDYMADGSLALREVGAFLQDDGAPPRISFGHGLELLYWEITPCAGTRCAELQLLWRAREPLAWGDTLFVHVLTPDGAWVSGADGDPLAGLVPLVAWPEGRLLRERRVLSTAELPEGDYAVTVGLYNRDTGRRYGAWLADGSPVTHGEPQIATLHVS